MTRRFTFQNVHFFIKKEWKLQQLFVSFFIYFFIIVLSILGLDILGSILVEIIHQIKSWKYTFKNKHVVITGGSSGLGLELAKRIAMQQATVTIIARNIEQLKQAKNEIDLYCTDRGLMTPHVFTESADICNQVEIQNAICNAVNKNGLVDIIICNAGMAKTGFLLKELNNQIDMHVDKQVKIINLLLMLIIWVLYIHCFMLFLK